MVENYDGCGGEDTLFWQFFGMDMEWTMVDICHALKVWSDFYYVDNGIFEKYAYWLEKKICLIISGYVYSGNVNTNGKEIWWIWRWRYTSLKKN